MAVTTQSSGAARRRFAAALSAAAAIMLLGLVAALAQATDGAKGGAGAKGTDIAAARSPACRCLVS
jgi:glycerate-2-kinase